MCAALALAAQDLEHREQADAADDERRGGLSALSGPALRVLDGRAQLVHGADQPLTRGLRLGALAFRLAAHALRASLSSSTVALASTMAASGVGAPALRTERRPMNARI